MTAHTYSDAMARTRTPPGAWFSSMRVRIVAVIIALQLASAVGAVVLLRTVLYDRLDDEIRVSLDREAEEFRLLGQGIDPDTAEPFDGDLPAIFDTYFRREVPDEAETLLAFYGDELYADLRATDVAEPEDLAEPIAFWQSLDQPRRGTIDTPLGEARYIALPLEGREQDGLWVVAQFPDLEREEIDDAVQTQAVVALLTLLMVTLVGLALAGRVLRPLRQVATTARRISDTDLTQRIHVTGRDEASQIATTFNDMLARLEQAFTTQRRFLDDTSHELRTPLTVVRGHLELLELSTSAQERQRTVALVTDEIDRFTRLVNDLFLIAQAQHPDFLQTDRIDLHELTLEIHRKASVLAERSWQLQAVADGVVTADRQRLTQAVLQLADNAVKYTEPGDVIRIGSALDVRTARLWVDDEGSGISPEDEQRVFQRFARGRHDETATDGAGLGLSIVGAIAQAHDGRVRLVRRPGPGTRFEISFPYS